MMIFEFPLTSVDYIGVWECCEGVEGEAAALLEEEEEREGAGWGLPQEEEEEEEDVEAAMAAAAAAAAEEVSIMLLWVMKRRRSFMAGRRVMMIFSTWTERKRMKMEAPIQTVRQTMNLRFYCFLFMLFLAKIVIF